MKTLVLFGDSITAGYGNEAICPILQQTIKQKLSTQQLECLRIINAGMPGDTTEDAMKRLENEVIMNEPNIVTIFFGANDASSDHLVPLPQYEKNIQSMIKQIGSEKVILITPPYVDSARNPSLEDHRMKMYVENVLAIGEEQMIPVINVYQEMTKKDDPAEFLQEDGLHFSKKGYDLLAALIVGALKGRLEAIKNS